MDTFKFYKNLDLDRPRYVNATDYDAAKPGDALPMLVVNPANKYKIEDPDDNQIETLKNLISRCIAHYPDFQYATFKDASSKTLITFGSFFLDGGLIPGSVTIISGEDTYSDVYSDGILYKDDSAVGIVAYKEGIILTNTEIAGDADIFVGRRSDLNTYMTIVHAEKDELNHSNNPTSSPINIESETARVYKENSKVQPANTIKPLAAGTTPDLEKQTFITKIGLYNKQKQLIAIATLANPLRKTENREFTFKLKLDI